MIAVTRVLPDSTPRAEPSVDTAGSGPQASRTSPPAALAAERTGPSLARHTKNRGVSRSGRRRDGKERRRRAETENVRVFVCHACNTADSVPWCGQLYCGHSPCMEELEKRAAKHRLTSGRFHGPVKLVVIGKNLWENHPHYAVTADAC